MRVILLAFASIGLPCGFCSSNDLHPAAAPLALLPSAPHGPAPVHLEKSLEATPAPSIKRLEIERRQAEVDSICGYWSDIYSRSETMLGSLNHSSSAETFQLTLSTVLMAYHALLIESIQLTSYGALPMAHTRPPGSSII
jgi:hypothetical protein